MPGELFFEHGSTHTGQLAAPTVSEVMQGQPKAASSATPNDVGAGRPSGGSDLADDKATAGTMPGELFLELDGANALYGAIVTILKDLSSRSKMIGVAARLKLESEEEFACGTIRSKV